MKKLHATKARPWAACKRIFCLALCALMLTACGAVEEKAPVSTLGPALMRYPCPSGDAALTYQSTVTLYLPSLDGQRLLAQHDMLTLNHAVHSARNVVRALLSYPANETVQALAHSANLTLYGASPVEVSGGVCTVNLASSALNLTHEAFYTLCLSMASTLEQLENIHYLNVLVADQAVGLDLAGYLPTGSVSAHPGEDINALWDAMSARATPLGQDVSAMPLTSAATLYFPLQDGSGFVPETRNITFSGQTPSALADGLLAALSAGARYVSGVCAVPDLYAMLIAPPDASEMTDGSRMITLNFDHDFLDRLSRLGIDPSCMIGAITYTLTTFIPSVSAVRVMCGPTMMTSLYSPALGTLVFQDGVQRRSQYGGMLMEQVSVCLARNGRLARVQRNVPCDSATNLRALMALLCNGPTDEEERAGYESVMPDNIDENDLLGITLMDDTLILNLSERFGQAIEAQTVNEQLLCYAMVNTLCEAKGLRRMCFYITGDNVGTLGGSLYWGGEFMVNRSLIAP